MFNVRHVHRQFALNGREVVGAGLTLVGGDIMEFLAGCDAVILMAATLGFDADRQIAALQATDMQAALKLNSAANAAIEGHFEGFKRFSPGFGDFPLDMQPKILQALDATRKIGLYCNDSHILQPLKSITAIVGVIS
jgi:5-methyltetrahydrofolate--homocysteine methyltransferase